MKVDCQRETPGAEEVAALYRRSGIHRPVDDLPRMAKMLSEANLVYSARLEGRLVGLARPWTDWSWMCFIADLAVEAEFQRQGIGRTLIDHVRKLVGPSVSVGLFAAPEAEVYYPRIGFKPTSGWRLPREL